MKYLCKIAFSLIIYISSEYCMAYDNIHEMKSEICRETLEDLASIGICIKIEDINNNDENGHRSGLWVEDNGHYIIITNYLDGKKNGIQQIFCRYSKVLKPSYIISHIDNMMRSIILFDETTGLTSVFVDNIKTNDESINYPVDWLSGNSFPYIGYSRYYNPSNGQLESEGYEVFGRDWEINCERVGQWKIYNKDGTFSVNDYGGYGVGLE